MVSRALMLSCGYFPDSLLSALDQEAADCFSGLKFGAAPTRVVCDFPVFGLPFTWFSSLPDELVGRDFWTDFTYDWDYYAALIAPGDAVHTFCCARDPAHRDALSLINRICVDCGAIQFLHLF